VHATHIIGGEVFYECQGNDDYLITLKIYRDCTSNTPFDADASIGFFDQSGNMAFTTFFSFPGSTNVPNNTSNPCWSAPPNICVEEAIYWDIVNIPPIPGGYDVVYQRCCRNGTIVNINTPGAVGSTYLAHIPDSALVSCNSSPFYNEFPPTVLCVGAPLVFDHSATDIDGDSLVYELCTPYVGADQFDPMPVPPPAPPYGLVPWLAGYSTSDPMDATPILELDPQTGLLTGTPTQIGQYVVGVCVNEYRNGVLLSTNKRDFQFNVAPCISNVVSAIQDQTIFCDGLTVDFHNLSMNSQDYLWDFGDPNTLLDTSTSADPTYTYQDTGVYIITLIANPAWPCADTAVTTFGVYPPIVPSFIPPPIHCFNNNSLGFVAGGQFQSHADFLWEFGNSTPTTSDAQDPVGIHFNALGDHEVLLTIFQNGCQESYLDTITIFPNPVPIFDTPKKVGCEPFTTQFFENSTAWTDIQWFWEFGDGNTSTDQDPMNTYLDAGLYDVSLTVMTDSACVDTVTLLKPELITVLPIPVAGFVVEPNEVTVLDPIVNVHDGSLDAITWYYVMGDGSTYNIPNFIHGFVEGGVFYVMQVVTNEFGCVDTAYQKVVVNDHLFFAPNAFTPDGDGINDEFLPIVTGAHEYELLVYDRWGEVIFDTGDPKKGWNGKVKGSDTDAPIDTYVYKAVVVDIGDNEREYLGHVTIVR